MSHRPAPFRLAAAILAVVTASVAGPALANAPYYQIRLGIAATQDKIIARELLWMCDGDRCVAGKSNSRPAIICRAVAKVAGTITAFSAGGKSMDDAALAACNGRDG